MANPIQKIDQDSIVKSGEQGYRLLVSALKQPILGI